MKKDIFFIVVISILFIGCVSTTSTSSRMAKLSSITNEIDNAILEKLNNVEIIIWEEGVLFKDLDLTKTVTIKEIYNSKTEIKDERKYRGQFYYDLFYSSTIIFEDTNGIEKKFNVSSREIYEIEGDSNYYAIYSSRGLLFGKYELSPTLILDITPDVSNLPWIYFGYNSSNVYGKYNSIDTRSPVRTGRILVYDTTVQYFYDRVLAQNADQPRRDRTSMQNLIQNLVDVDFNVGTPFREGDIVSIPQGLLSAVDLSQTNRIYTYLVMLNDQSLKPFYIQTTRRFSNIGSNNTIYESLRIEYIGTAEYIQNKVQVKSTLLFRLLE
jgi:hypothetical protein